MPISTNDNWGEKPFPSAASQQPETGRLVDPTSQDQLIANQAADERAHAASARSKCWDLTGRQFADKRAKDDAERDVITMCDAGYIDRDTRDSVIRSFRVRPIPKTLAERRAEIENKLADKESAYSMSADTFKKLWDSI